MNIVVVGAGAQGAPCAAVLARQPCVGRVLIGSRTLAAAEGVRDRLNRPSVLAAALDADQVRSSAAVIQRSIGGADVVIDVTPSACARNVMELALVLGAHYVNTAACAEHLDQFIRGHPLDLADRFAAAGRTALLGCGVSPGLVNILCRRFCDELDSVERIEIRVGFPVPAQREMIRSWTPTWSPEQQYLDFCDPPCVFDAGRHKTLPVFHEPERYDFGGELGTIELTHHAHDEPYTLPLTIGKGIRHCSLKYPFEPAVATFYAAGFTTERRIHVDGHSVRALDVLMAMLPRPAAAVMDRAAQERRVGAVAAIQIHLLIEGAVAGRARRFKVTTGAFFDQAALALDLFGNAKVSAAYAAAAGALMLAEGGVRSGILWPEELDAEAFISRANGMGLRLNYQRLELPANGTAEEASL